MTINPERLEQLLKNNTHEEILACLDIMTRKKSMKESEMRDRSCVLQYSQNGAWCQKCLGSNCATYWVTLRVSDGEKVGVCTA